MDVLDKFFIKYSYKFPKGYPDLKDKQDILLMESILEELGVRVRMNEKVEGFGQLSHSEILKRPFRLSKFIEIFQKGGEFLNYKTGDDLIITKITIDGEDFQPSSDLSSFEDKFENSSNDKIKITHQGGIDKLNILTKTEEFGGGGGIKGSTSQTKTQESSQCLVNSLRQNKGVLSLEDISDTEGLKKAFNNVDVDESLDQIIEFIQNSNWQESLIGTANLLAKKYGTDYIQHRGSSFVNTLYKQYNKLRKKDERIGKGRLGADKWNPSDIWMVKEGLESTIEDLILSSEDLDELNVLLLQQYLDKNLIGVSLKKSDLSPNTSEFNTTGLTQNIDYVYGGYKPLSFTTKSTFIFFDKDKNTIEFRTFPSFSGEIEGSKAAGGKIGFTPLNIVFKNLGLPTLEDPKSVTNEKFIELWNQFSDEKISEKELNQKLEKISNEKVRGKDYLKGEAGSKDWIQSRYFGLQVLDRINQAGSQQEKDKVIENMLKYAASNSEWSSSFIKVS